MLATDPVCLALTDEDDIEIPLRFLSGAEAVAQGIRVRLLMVRGEWFADLSAGTPWIERDNVPASEALLGQRYDKAKVEAEIRRQILDTPNVIGIESLTTEFNGITRALEITFEAKTAFGDTPETTLEVEV